MDELTAHLEELMYGHNYAPTFGLLPLPAATSPKGVEAAIVRAYPEAELLEPHLTDAAAMWQAIDEGFDYRGDAGAGLELTDEQEVELRGLQDRYRDYVRGFVGSESVVYTGGCRGLPGYSVFWGYLFFVLNPDRDGLLLFADASD